jgi:hypothetical protein
MPTDTLRFLTLLECVNAQNSNQVVMVNPSLETRIEFFPETFPAVKDIGGDHPTS